MVLNDTKEEETENTTLRMINLRNPFKEMKWTGDYSEESELWTEPLKKLFDYYPPTEDNNTIIEYNDFIRYFHYITICVPLRPLKCQIIEIPKEKAADYNVIKLKFEKKGVFSLSIERQSPRFHKDLKKKIEAFENLLLAKIDKEAKKLVSVANCYNETLSTRVEPGEYLIEINLDYKTAGITDIRPYNIHIASTTDYKIKLVDPDEDLTLMKTIMVPKIESLQRYKLKFKEQFVFFTGNRFEATSFGFCYMKNKSKETKFLRPQYLLKNFKSIEGEPPKYLRMEPGSKFFMLFNRVKAGVFFQTGINPGFYKEDTIGSIEPEVKEYGDDKYFLDNIYENAKPCYEFCG